MAYSDNFPATRPVFMADFANGGKIDPRATFSRASTGSYFGTEKVLSSENLLLQSQDFDTTWGLSYMAAPTGSQTAPDGTSTAWLLTCNIGTNVGPRIFQSYTATASTEYTAVAHLKAGTATHGYLSIRTNSGNYYAGSMIDFSAGTIAVTSAGMTDVSGTVTALGSDWFKVTIKATSGSSLTSPQITVGVSDGSAVGGNGRPVWSPVGTETMYAWGVQLSTTGATVYDSPTTTQIARSYQTKLQTAASGAARFEHSATDGQSGAKGLLIEGQVQNLFGYTEDFTQSDWTPTTSAITTGAAVAPSGDLTANLVVPNSGASFGQFYQTETLNSGTVYTLSFFAKNAGWGSGISLFFGTTGPWGSTGDQRYAQFNLSTGEAVLESGGVTGSSEDVGNGWRRYSVTTPATTVTTSAFPGLAVVNLSGSSITGDGYSGVLAWGAQLVPLSFSGSYVGSSSSSGATKALDSLSVTDSSLFGTGSGSVVVEAGPVNGTFYPTLFDLTDTTTSNRVLLQSGGTGTPTSLTVAADGNASVGVVSEAVTMSDRKFAVSYDTNSFKLVNNGGAVSEDTSGQLPKQLSKLNIGTDNGGGGPLNGNIKRIAVFGEPLSDSNLQAITS